MKEGILRYLIEILSDIPASRGDRAHRGALKLGSHLRAEQLEFNLARVGRRNSSQQGEGRRHVRTLLALTILGTTSIHAQEYLGQLSVNPNAADSTANAYGVYGSAFSPDSINNPNSPFGSSYSPTGVNNPYATEAPSIVAQDGTYLGQVSANPYDPESSANEFGIYGSPYSPVSINNPYGQYGSASGPQSANNPYALDAPSIISR